MEPLSFARAIFDIGRDLSQRTRRVRVRTHDAIFLGSSDPMVMVSVVNLGQRPITITHVWFAITPPLHVINPTRPLPKELSPDEPWETWAPLAAFGTRLNDISPDQLLRAARVRLSTGREVKARPNRNVPDVGAVPGSQS